jgi:succinate dehydrogenase / fumarate reductase cytochrome b subunit
VITLREALGSSVGRKLITSITGIGMALFVILHLVGNLFLYPSDGSTFNEYAHMMAGKKTLVLVADLILLTGFILHAVNSILLKLQHRKARGQGYQVWRSKAKGLGTPSSRSSRTMALSGLVLLFFIPFHVNHFKFGPGTEQGYVTSVGGESARDLHRWVIETFQSPGYVALYVFVMLMLWGHLKHGYWSFFQSFGWVTPRTYQPLRWGGAALATVLAFGFLMIPLWIYIRHLAGWEA